MSIIVKSGGGSGADTGIFAEYGSSGYPKTLKIELPTIPENAFGSSSILGNKQFVSEATLIEIKTTDIGKSAFYNFFRYVADNAKLKIDATSIGQTSFLYFLRGSGSNVKVWISSNCSSIASDWIGSDTENVTAYCEAESAGSGWGAEWSKYLKSVMYGVTEAEFDAL